MSKLFALLFISSLALGCSGGDDDDFKTVVCSAGETQACVCGDGKDGAQTCKSDNTAWGACKCAASPDDGGAAGAPAVVGCVADSQCPHTARACVSGQCADFVPDGEICDTSKDPPCTPGNQCVRPDGNIAYGFDQGICLPWPRE